MKTFIALLILLPLFSHGLFAQSLPVPDSTETNARLETLCKVWGLLKYHHPNIAKGKVEWDAVLLDQLPQAKEASTQSEFGLVLREMCRAAGNWKIKPHAPDFDPHSTFVKNVKLGWIQQDPNIPDALREPLLVLTYLKKPKNHHFVLPMTGGGKTPFVNEIQYDLGPYPNYEYRVLALFRYWNAVQYLFPYKYQATDPWEETLSKFLPLIVEANDTREYQLAFAEMFAQLPDGHADGSYSPWLMDNFIGGRLLPFRALEVEGRVILDQPIQPELFSTSGFQLGDEIVKVDGKTVSERIREVAPYVAGSHPAGKGKGQVNRLLRSTEPQMRVTRVRDQDTLEVITATYSFKELRAFSNERDNIQDLGKGMAYVNMGEIRLGEVEATANALQAYKGVIFDLRYYPRETGWEWAKYLMGEPTPFISYTFPDPRFPGRYTYTKPRESPPRAKHSAGWDKPIVLLVNERTQSQGEFCAMLFQAHPRTVTVGTQSAGANGGIIYMKLPGDLYAYWSGIGVFYPDQTETQTVGVKIDHSVEVSATDLKNGIDPILEAGKKVLFVEIGTE